MCYSRQHLANMAHYRCRQGMWVSYIMDHNYPNHSNLSKGTPPSQGVTIISNPSLGAGDNTPIPMQPNYLSEECRLHDSYKPSSQNLTANEGLPALTSEDFNRNPCASSVSYGQIPIGHICTDSFCLPRDDQPPAYGQPQQQVPSSSISGISGSFSEVDVVVFQDGVSPVGKSSQSLDGSFFENGLGHVLGSESFRSDK
ncbi:hypothetical protein AG1IA_04927 [Rhizoctonia solani AG-1 IA]|uniref:Uncharacterized protein n=1 Tax=Thanatephorus cucumeris (strain AG1-IA) TaxID=983506 RepID=L8WXF5_THACA|nr:hypothetical protein AG1IA_04927 [Rhizoctonia solani AG-1 IA]